MTTTYTTTRRLADRYVRDVRIEQRALEQKVDGGDPFGPYAFIGRDYGDLTYAIASGRARCRACGEKINRGDRCLSFVHDFAGSGSWTGVQCYMHENTCEKDA